MKPTAGETLKPLDDDAPITTPVPHDDPVDVTNCHSNVPEDSVVPAPIQVETVDESDCIEDLSTYEITVDPIALDEIDAPNSASDTVPVDYEVNMIDFATVDIPPIQEEFLARDCGDPLAADDDHSISRESFDIDDLSTASDDIFEPPLPVGSAPDNIDVAHLCRVTTNQWKQPGCSSICHGIAMPELPKDMSEAALLDYCHARQDPTTRALYGLETKIETLHVSKIAYYASLRADHADAIQDHAHVDGGS